MPHMHIEEIASEVVSQWIRNATTQGAIKLVAVCYGSLSLARG